MSARTFRATRSEAVVRNNDIAGKQLRVLCDVLGLQSCFPEYLLLQRFLFDSWGAEALSPEPAYASRIGDDHSPYEYSVAFSGREVELRLLFEAQALEPSLGANHQAALDLTARIGDVFPVGLDRFEAVLDLFSPDELGGAFSLWHAVSLRKDKKPKFKVYLNPQVRGKHEAEPLVAEALARLGLGGAAKVLREEVARRGPTRDELNYFSLDLADDAAARVKVYYCHHQATAAELERSFSACARHEAGDVAEFCFDMVGHGGPFVNKPVTSCFSFTEGSDRPRAATFHLPIAHYADNDRLVGERVAAFLFKHDMDADRYRELLTRFASRPLGAGAGIQSYTSYRRDANGMLMTVYLSPELFDSVARAEGAADEALPEVMPASPWGRAVGTRRQP